MMRAMQAFDKRMRDFAAFDLRGRSCCCPFARQEALID